MSGLPSEEEENDYWFQYGWDEAKRRAEDELGDKIRDILKVGAGRLGGNSPHQKGNPPAT